MPQQNNYQRSHPTSTRLYMSTRNQDFSTFSQNNPIASTIPLSTQMADSHGFGHSRSYYYPQVSSYSPYSSPSSSQYQTSWQSKSPNYNNHPNQYSYRNNGNYGYSAVDRATMAGSWRPPYQKNMNSRHSPVSFSPTDLTNKIKPVTSTTPSRHERQNYYQQNRYYSPYPSPSSQYQTSWQSESENRDYRPYNQYNYRNNGNSSRRPWEEGGMIRN